MNELRPVPLHINPILTDLIVQGLSADGEDCSGLTHVAIRALECLFDLHSVMRDDVARPSLPREQVLANAPRQEDGFFRVQAVLET